jgi:hypothetical protein
MSQNIKQHKIWTAEDDQLLIDTFNRYQYDVKVAKFTRKQLGRGDTAVRARLSRLRSRNLIGDSVYTARRRSAELSRNQNKETTIVQQVLQPIVKEQKNDELTLIKLIISKLGTEQKLELIKSMLA